MKELEIKAAKVIQFILEDELEQYSHYEYKITESEMEDKTSCRVEAEIENANDCCFRVKFNDEIFNDITDENYHQLCEVEICLSSDGDHWEKIETFDWTIKYLWMVMLEGN